MTQNERVVYLEDIQSTSQLVEKSTEEPAKPPTEPSGQPTAVKPAALKRQLTLMDMVAGPRKDENTAKRAKIATDGASAIRAKVPAPAKMSFGLQKLNSVPFSMAEYQESLSEEQRRLLKLECEVLGLSWFADTFFFLPFPLRLTRFQKG